MNFFLPTISLNQFNELPPKQLNLVFEIRTSWTLQTQIITIWSKDEQILRLTTVLYFINFPSAKGGEGGCLKKIPYLKFEVFLNWDAHKLKKNINYDFSVTGAYLVLPTGLLYNMIAAAYIISGFESNYSAAVHCNQIRHEEIYLLDW